MDQRAGAEFHDDDLWQALATGKLAIDSLVQACLADAPAPTRGSGLQIKRLADRRLALRCREFGLSLARGSAALSFGEWRFVSFHPVKVPKLPG